MELGSNLVFNHFRRFGLQMHVVSKSKPSKKECVFFPAPGHFKILTLTSTAIPTDSSSSNLAIPKHKMENEERRQKRNDQKYEDAEKTKSIRIGETGKLTIHETLQVPRKLHIILTKI